MKLDIRNKDRWTLFGIEVIAIGILTSVWLVQKYNWDLITGIITSIAIISVIGFLFFQIRLFRYLFAVLFSFFWGFVGYTLVESATNFNTTSWVAFFLIIALSLYLHKDYFRFERGF